MLAFHCRAVPYSSVSFRRNRLRLCPCQLTAIHGDIAKITRDRTRRGKKKKKRNNFWVCEPSSPCGAHVTHWERGSVGFEFEFEFDFLVFKCTGILVFHWLYVKY